MVYARLGCGLHLKLGRILPRTQLSIIPPAGGRLQQTVPTGMGGIKDRVSGHKDGHPDCDSSVLLQNDLFNTCHGP